MKSSGSPKRKTEIKRYTKLRPVGLKRKKTKRPAKPRFVDGKGVPFDEYHLWLPPRLADWPKGPPRVLVDHGKLQGEFHREWEGKPCWWDEKHVGKELHHLCSIGGRSHERTLFTWTCSGCHREHVGKEDLGRWLWLKVMNDAANTDWVLLALRHGSFLPELVTE